MNTTSHLPCTCQIPSCVELNDSPTSKAALLENLRQWGWSPVQWDASATTGIPPPTADKIRKLFTTATTNSENDDSSPPLLKYRALESGGSMTVEPKESLELEQSQIAVGYSMVDPAVESAYHQVKDWCLTLSKIAHVVNQMLDIPSNLLLVHDDEDDDHDHNDDDATNNNNTTICPNDRLDLLRVFYYHPVPQHSTVGDDNEENSVSFGSSPHTDWGSWTVVWQDAVGGLETYCRRCQIWIPVPPNSSTSSTSTSTCPESITTTTSNTNTPVAASDQQQQQDYIWNCIVHVGDLASLALGKELPPPIDNEDSNEDASDKKKDGDGVQWPSPRHRVLSPTLSPRTSLVYFAYPPPNLSLQQLQEGLQVVHWNCHSRGVRLPLSEYYLLQDQSSSSTTTTSTTAVANNDTNDLVLVKEQQAAASYQKLRSLSIREVIQTKWAQVQREFPGSSTG